MKLKLRTYSNISTNFAFARSQRDDILNKNKLTNEKKTYTFKLSKENKVNLNVDLFPSSKVIKSQRRTSKNNEILAVSSSVPTSGKGQRVLH